MSKRETTSVFHGLAILMLVVCQTGLISGCTATCHDNYDILIKGGTVYDGTKAEPSMADIGINGDRIAAIGNLTGRGAAKTINAAGYAVTPGFIDVHTHVDLMFLLAGDQVIHAPEVPEWKTNHNYLFQGVTTIVTGNYADITIIDLKTIKELGTYKDPAKYPAGFKYVIVNGEVAINDGKATGNTGGRALKRE